MPSSCFSRLASMLLLAGALQAGPAYKLDHRIPMPGDAGWDYISVDAADRRLFLSRGSQVDVLDLDSEKIVGSVTGCAGVHGIAVASDLGRGYISNGMSGTVKVFDLKSLATRMDIKVGKNPDAILYDPFTKRVFAFNGKSKDMSVIDTADGKVLATVDLGTKPEFAVSDGKGSLFVNFEDRDSIAAIDAKSMKVRSVWPLKAKSPSGLALDKEHMLLFSVCDGNKMEVVDAVSGSVTAEVAIGGHPDAAVFDPGTQLAFSSNGEGNLTVAQEISPTAVPVLDTIATQKGARTLALDPTTHNVYMLCARYLSETATTPGQQASPTGLSATAAPEHHRPKIEPGSVELLVLKKL
jgi:YVTN family beta-propeller protein